MDAENTLPIEHSNVEWRRVMIFCALALAISGSAAVYLAQIGGLAALSGINGFLILALWYMSGPAVAHILTRVITREGWRDLGLRVHLKEDSQTRRVFRFTPLLAILRLIRRIPSAYAVAWVAPALLVIAGAVLYFAIFPQYFDPTMATVRGMLDQAAVAGTPLPFGVEMLILIQVTQAVLLAPLLNALPTLGEEFGWRAYLQPKLMPLGWRRAMVWMGVIWGVWHWPILALGYNYGLDYAGAPWWGMLAFVWFTFTFGTLLGWLTIRGGSVWPAVIGHGALNGIAALPALFVQGEPNPLFGPLAHGLLAGIPVAIVALWLWWHPPVKP